MAETFAAIEACDELLDVPSDNGEKKGM